MPSVVHWIARAAEDTVAGLLHTFLPSDCRLCGAPVLSARAVRVCEACIADAIPARAPGPACRLCGVSLGMESARFAAGMGIVECTLCRLAPPAFTRAVAAADYGATMRGMLQQLKYDDARSMAESLLGARLAQAIQQLPLGGREILVVPVPLFAARRRERGYNQATLLARAALRELRKLQPQWKLRLAPQFLDRVKDTRAMYTLQPHQRRRSLQDAFRARHKKELTGREVLLLDDIMTTGATARECARVLRAAGATTVWVATVARAQPDAATSANSTARWTTPTPPPDLQLIAPRRDRQHTFTQERKQ